MESVSTVLKKALLALLVASAGCLCCFKLSGDWAAFQNCPNTDVLSWDANLRFIYTLDARDDVMSGHGLRALLASLRSPTWPPLHGWIASAAYLFTSPSPKVEAGIGLAFYAALCTLLVGSGIWLAGREQRALWLGAAASVFTLICLFHSKELTAYSLSAMLETQGMFFFLLTLLALYRMAREQTGPGFLLISSLGLFLTKFPYGHILIMAVVPAALFHERQAVPDLLRFLRSSYRGKAALLPVVLVLITLFLGAVRFTPQVTPNVKLFKYSFYLVVCLLAVDFNVKLYRARNELDWMPALWRSVYLYVCLPILVLTLLEPDRFSSTVGTQLHQQDSSRSFLLSIFRDSSDSAVPLVCLFGFLAVLGSIAAVRSRKAPRSPLAFALLVVLMHLFILELLTSNKQVRHIYHLMPALLLFSFIAALNLAAAWRSYLDGAAAGATLLSTTVFFAGPGSVFASTHRVSRYTCWTGPDRSMFAPVRDAVLPVQAHVSNRKTLIVNDFHEPGAPLPGALWATDLDLLLRFQLNFRVRNDSRHTWKSWDEFDRLLHVAATCDESLPGPLASRARDMNVSLAKQGSYRATLTAPVCITDYRISGTAETQ